MSVPRNQVTDSFKFAKMTAMPNLREPNLYRPNVAALIVRPTGLVLAGRRQGVPDAWQLPQGGIEKKESPEEAVLREAEEETGLTALTIVARTPDWIYYEWPKGFKKKPGPHIGQKQIYFVLRQTDSGAKAKEPKLSDEFEEFRWMPFQELLNLTIPFRQQAYREAYEILKRHL